MSGPKSFSVHVFDTKLATIFSLQSQINQIFKELHNFLVNDKELAIRFDCSNFIDKNQNEINKQLKSFDLGLKKTVSSQKRDKIEKKINEKIKSLQKVLAKMVNQKNDFLDKRQDYLSYVSYNQYFENSHNSFKQFKANLTNYLNQNLKNDNPEIFRSAENKIEQIKPDIQKLGFQFGFQKIEEKSKQAVTQHINKKEEQVSEIRNQIAKNKLLESIAQKNNILPTINVKNEEEIKQLAAKINDKIDFIEDDKQRANFKSKFNELQHSKVFTDAYFYKEFLDGLSQSEQNQQLKRNVKNYIYEINNTETADDLLNKKNKILQNAIKLLESEKIKQYQFDDFKTKYYWLKQENSELLENEFVKQKENEYLKTQLFNGLQNMNYRVMDDMEVIDFEKQSDFLFKVPNQSNYINLRIDKNNNVAYNFLIEENKNDLSIEQKRKKAIEMESTCDEFHQMLKNLESMGLEIDQTKKSDVGIDKLLQVPKKYRDKIKEAAKERERTKERIVKKKYLDE